MKKAVFVAVGVCSFAFLFSLLFDTWVQDNIAIVQYPYLDTIFFWITSFVNVFVILILITTLFLIQEKKREWIPPLWISFAVAAASSYLIKFLVKRPRPTDELFSQIFTSLNYSFPSLHAMVAFSVVPILAKEFPKIKWAWIILAVLIAFSRIYFEYHYLSDVIFGAGIGYLIGMIVIAFEKKYKLFAFLK